MENRNILSPPKPKRHVLPLPPELQGGKQNIEHDKDTKYLPDGGDIETFETQMTDQAVADLPSVFTEVFNVQRDQSHEIKRQREILAFLQEKLKEAEERNGDLEAEVVTITNKIYTKDELIKDTNKKIKRLETELQQLVRDEVEGQLKLKQARDHIDMDAADFKRYSETMDGHKAKVLNFETTKSAVYKQLKDTEDELQKLREQKSAYDTNPGERDRVSSGEKEREVQTELDQLKSQLLDTGSEMKRNLEKIAEERARQKQISQSMKVLEKRNAAQLTRLKRQLKEIQARNRLKETQVRQLRENVEQARSNLGQ